MTEAEIRAAVIEECRQVAFEHARALKGTQGTLGQTAFDIARMIGALPGAGEPQPLPLHHREIPK